MKVVVLSAISLQSISNVFLIHKWLFKPTMKLVYLDKLFASTMRFIPERNKEQN